MFSLKSSDGVKQKLFLQSDAGKEEDERRLKRIDALRIMIITLSRAVESLAAEHPDQKQKVINLADEVRRFEVELIRSSLILTGGRKRRAARLLGVKASTLIAKIKRYNIETVDDPGSIASTYTF
jgi:DNA-binding NtrC family response regulator